VDTKTDCDELRTILEKHVKYTGSIKAQKILENYEENLPKFKKIIPEDYKKLIAATRVLEEGGMSREEAQIEAFYKCTAD